MKILVITNLYPPHSIGGYEIRCQETVNYLRSKNHQVSVLTSYYGIAHPTQDDGVYRLLKHQLHLDAQGFNRWPRILFSHQDVKHLQSVIKQCQPDLIYIFNMYGLSLQLFKGLENVKIPKVFDMGDEWIMDIRRFSEQLLHYWEDIDQWKKYRWLKRILWLGLKHIVRQRIKVNWNIFGDAKVIFASQNLKERYQKAGFRFKNSTVLHHGIDMEQFSPVKDNLDDKNVRLIYVGQVEEHKGVHVILEALSQLVQSQKEKNFTLDLVGGSTSVWYRGMLEDLIKKKNLKSHVRFHGQVHRARIVDYFRESDILLFPVLCEEGFGRTLIEAMGCGIPVVSTFSGGAQEFLKDRVNCLVVPKGDSKALFERIKELVDHPDLKKNLVRHAQEMVMEKFADKDIFEKKEQILVSPEPKETFTADPHPVKRIAVYHNLPTGGAKRALFQFIKEISQRYDVDEYTLDMAASFLPLKNFVCHSYVYKAPKFNWPRLRPYLLDRLVFLFRRIFQIHSIQSLSRKIAKDINSRGYDLVYIDHSRLTHAPSILRYIRLPKLYFCHDPRRSILEGFEFETKNMASSHFLKKIYIHAWHYINTLGERYTNWVDKKNVRSADFILTNSCYTREYIHKVYNKFAHVNYLGVDTDLFQKKPYSKDNFILSVGRIYKVKGHHCIIRALALIEKEKRPPLRIIGDCSSSEEKMYLLQLAKENDVDVHLDELIDDQELVKAYNCAQMVVYVPIMEPFGFVPLEAMACGTAVVGVAEGGIRESIVDNQTGLLVHRDDQELADAIMRLLQDESLRQRLETNGLHYVKEKWTWEKAAESMEKNFEKCVKGFTEGNGS